MNLLKLQLPWDKELSFPPRMGLLSRFMHGVVRCSPVRSKFQMDFILFKKPIFAGRAEESLTSKGIILRRATEDDLDQMIRHPECRIPEVYHNRLADDHGVFCAVKDGEIHSFVWINFEVICSFYGTTHQIIMKKLADQTCFLYDLYTYRKFRNRGTAAALLNYVEAFLGNSGVSHLAACVSPSNIPTVILFSKKQYKPVNIFHVYRIMGIKKCFQGNKQELQLIRRWINSFLLIQ